jgi:hypothetical protein
MVGCSTPKNGLSGPLLHLSDPAALAAYLKGSKPAAPVAMVLGMTIVSRQTLDALAAHSGIKALLSNTRTVTF